MPLLRSRDIVILHDPQTAGLIEALRRTGAVVIWRCHVGRDPANQYAREAWSFLRGYVLEADALVFSRAAFAWEGLPEDRISVIQLSIDAFSPKNAEQRLGSRSRSSRGRESSPTIPRTRRSPAQTEPRVASTAARR